MFYALNFHIMEVQSDTERLSGKPLVRGKSNVEVTMKEMRLS